MSGTKSNGIITSWLMLAVFLWGASNAGSKFVLASWPPIWVGTTRFLCAGLLMLAILRWTTWLGVPKPIKPALKRDLWLRGGLSLAIYIVAFNWAMQLTSASHVALYLGASPVWALLWEERPSRNWRSAQRYGATLLALSGVVVLVWPSLKFGNTRLGGEMLGLTASIMWANYGRQGRVLAASLTGAEVSAHTMWRAGLLLLPLALIEIFGRELVWRADLVLVQTYCFVGGGVCAYALWNNALMHWPTSRVFLFNNLIPLSTMSWAYFCLNEPFTKTFLEAMVLIVSGVVLGQVKWEKVMGRWWAPMD
ncbi:DMT family transporter [Pedosphaera parvula]|uniref:DMT family transporter n=1 Tax=Pedosphaera parvula TaxID=1032527 RepID=UPI00135F1334|nr:DMT family transporter [Pedosphaera parvula]